MAVTFLTNEDGKKFVKSINNVQPDENGNVEITIENPDVDLTGYATEEWVQESYQPKGEYLTEHQDISGKLDANKLPEAINSALAQAKASGEFDGADGKDYILTTDDKAEIAEMAADLVDVPDYTDSTDEVYILSENETLADVPDGIIVVIDPDGKPDFDIPNGGNVELDTTLTQSGKAADAKAVGDILATLTLGQHTDGLVYIFIGGQPVGNGLSITGGEVVEPVYGQPVTDSAILSIAKGQTVQLGVMLSEEPTQEQTITILTECAALSFDKTILTFTPDDWNVFQFVSVAAGDVDEDTTATIILQNSDKLLTDTNIIVYLTADGYAVDTTIPTEGQHVVTVDDFGKTNVYGDYIRLYNYIGEYDNIVIPSELDGKIPWILCGNNTATVDNWTFLSDDEHTKLKYVTFEDGVICRGAGTTSGCDATSIFEGQTELIGVSNMNPAVTMLNSAFYGCTSLKFVDNIGELVNVTKMESAFEQATGIEYIPDLSALTAVISMKKCFCGCANLKRVYGMPKPSATCDMSQVFYGGCTALEKGEIPENVTVMQYAFGNCTALRSVEVRSTGVTNANEAFKSCSDLTVYVVADSTTYNTINSKYGSSTAVTIAILGCGESLPVIAVWGDSTSSPNRTWKEWPRRLSEVVTSYSIKNQAVSGEYTTSTSARQGGNALSVGAFTIPADTSLVEITLTSADGQTFGSKPVFNHGGAFNPCTIAGVQGTIISSGGVCKFARRNPGNSVEVPSGTAVTSDADGMFNNADAVMLVNIGINAGWNTDSNVLLNQVQMMVNHFAESGGTKYIITGPYAGQFLVGESDREVVFAYETKAATAFGEHWMNLREYLISNGLTENGLTASELDNQRMAVGLIPASLLGGGSTTDIPMYDGKNVTDQTHPNSYGQNSIFNAFYAKGKALGYWT